MGIWSNLADSFNAGFSGDTPLYGWSKDNSVANAYNSWLAQERNAARAEEQASRNAELQSQQQLNQMLMTQAMNEFNMDKYAQQEQAKTQQQNLKEYIEAYSKLAARKNANNEKLSGKLDNTIRSKLEAENAEISSALEQLGSIMPPAFKTALSIQSDVSDAGLSAAKEQKRKDKANYEKSIANFKEANPEVDITYNSKANADRAIEELKNRPGASNLKFSPIVDRNDNWTIGVK